MSIIQKAAQRLEELNRAGVSVPQAPASGGPSAPMAESRTSPPGPRVVPAPGADRPVRRSAEVELNLQKLEADGFLVPSHARSLMSEEFRHIKQPLLRAAREAQGQRGHRGGLIMVTSALPREGKTFCAINLALSMAMEVDTSVLLVDADVVRPAVLDRLGLPPGRGLLDVLTDPSLDLSEVMLRTNIPKLSLLPAGTRNARSTELLGSDAMERLLVDLSNRYSDRVVIFDAPPLLLTSEAKVLAGRLGQVVMVVEAANTPRSSVNEAFAAVSECPNVVTVLNRCAEPVADNRYGYYY
ncbi:MAG: XrtA-associated tyrosine autokinase [Pseudomonadota bacterium]